MIICPANVVCGLPYTVTDSVHMGAYFYLRSNNFKSCEWGLRYELSHSFDAPICLYSETSVAQKSVLEIVSRIAFNNLDLVVTCLGRIVTSQRIRSDEGRNGLYVYWRHKSLMKSFYSKRFKLNI